MTDPHLREYPLGGELLHEGGFLTLRRDRVRLPDGSTATRDYIAHSGAASVLPLLDDGRVLLVRQYRHAVGRVMLEIPAGKVDAGESPFDCARRELLEETGCRASDWARAAVIHNAAAYSTENIEIWFAKGLTMGEPALDAGEFIELCTLTEAEFERLAAAGEISDVKTLVALLWLQKWRTGAWPLSWVGQGSAATTIMPI